MGLVLKYARLTKAGTWQYRRRIPTAVRNLLDQGEFKRFLGATRPEAMKAYPKVDLEFERLVAHAKRNAADAVQPSTALEIHQEAQRLAIRMANGKVFIGGQELDGSHPDAADILHESYLAGIPTDPDTGEHVGGDAVTNRAFGILASGGRLERPVPTLADAKLLYIAERIKGDINETAKKSRIERVMGYLSHAIKDDRPLAKLTREDAREVRDYMIRDLHMKPSTVKRYMNDIRALVTLGITEFGLRDAINPFLGLSIRTASVARDERSPIPEKTLKAIGNRMSAHAGPDLWQIWRMIEGTGCRLGEISGLLVSDVKIDAPIPYIDLVNHPHRRLKTAGSVRRVPLVGTALDAAREALNAAGKGQFLFPRYGRVRGADGASASLMKHVRTVTEDPKIVVHSLRHTMEDRLIRARIDEFDRNLVLGHSRGSMGERYGGPDARLEVAVAAVKAALALSK